MSVFSYYRGRRISILPLLLILFGHLRRHIVSSLSTKNPRRSNGVGTTPSSCSNPSHVSSVSRRDWLVSGSVGLSGLLWNAAPAIATGDGSDSPAKSPRLGQEYYNNPVVSEAGAGRSYFPALTPPFRNRATYRYDLGRDTWALEQLLTFANVTATIRCNVVRLKSTGGLWVHSPQWPTGEFCSLLEGIGGPIEHVVLPCNAFEHKAPMQAFVEKYPNAKVWVAPGQYGPLGKHIRDCQSNPSEHVPFSPTLLTLKLFIFHFSSLLFQLRELRDDSEQWQTADGIQSGWDFR